MTPPSTWSLRARVVAHIGIAAGFVWICLAAVVYWTVRANSANAFDRELERHGTVVLTYAEHEYLESSGAVSLDETAEARTFREEFALQILTRDGVLLARSRAAPTESLGPLLRAGFNDVDTANGTWRVLTLISAKSPVIIKVAQAKSLRETLTLGVARSLLWPLLLALPLLLFLAAVVVKRILRPFEEWRAALEDDLPGDHSRVATTHLPTEMQPVARSLNALLDRQSRWIEHERAFTANAAHELRTPLAALRTQTQVALRVATSPEAQAALQKQLAAIDRMSRLVTQMLALARVDAGGSADAGETANLEQATRLVIQELCAAKECTPERIRLAVSVDDALVGLSSEVAVLIVRNLLHNALHHGGSEPIDVRLGVQDGQIVLEILDRGPGLEPSERSKVTQRFYRVVGSSSHGSGLGLSIVNRVIETAGGSLRFADTDDAHGLHVIVSLPRVRLANSAPASHTQNPQTTAPAATLTFP